MPRTDFTLIADFKAIVAASIHGTNPDTFNQAVTGLVTFTPSKREVWSELDERLYILEPIEYRIDDGVLADIPRRVLDDSIPAEVAGEPPDHRRYGVRLAANGDAFGPLPVLDYTVSFRKIVFNKRDQKLPRFSFPAPREDIVVDLATVHHRTSKLT